MSEAVKCEIVRERGGWSVKSEAGKHLGGPYPREQAERRLRQVEHFSKHRPKSMAEAMQAHLASLVGDSLTEEP